VAPTHVWSSITGNGNNRKRRGVGGGAKAPLARSSNWKPATSVATYGADGKIETVRYSMLSAMLLNELQKQNKELMNQRAANQRQAEQIRRLNAQVGTLTTQVALEKSSTDRKIAKLEGSHDRELRAMQAAFERRLSALERSTGTGEPVQVKF
jgi:hypothetical protein